MQYTRRELCAMALAALPLAGESKFNGVQIGAITYSFGPMPASDIISSLTAIGITEVELMSNHCEALAGAPPPLPPRPGRAPLTPDEQAARAQAAEATKAWRLSTSDAPFKAVKKQFNNAGMDLRILCFNQRMNATDDEIEYAFQMAKALDVKAISSSSTVSFAKRVAPFADKHRMPWAGHGHDDINNPEEFSTPQSFEMILGYSKYIAVNLDIGHFTAAGYDPVFYLKKIHSRVTNIHLKDRKKPSPGIDHPPNVVWGEGDTPIQAVLQLMEREKYDFPANIELEYKVPEGSDRVTEMKRCLQFCKEALT